MTLALGKVILKEGIENLSENDSRKLISNGVALDSDGNEVPLEDAIPEMLKVHGGLMCNTCSSTPFFRVMFETAHYTEVSKERRESIGRLTCNCIASQGFYENNGEGVTLGLLDTIFMRRDFHVSYLSTSLPSTIADVFRFSPIGAFCLSGDCYCHCRPQQWEEVLWKFLSFPNFELAGPIADCLIREYLDGSLFQAMSTYRYELEESLSKLFPSNVQVPPGKDNLKYPPQDHELLEFMEIYSQQETHKDIDFMQPQNLDFMAIVLTDPALTGDLNPICDRLVVLSLKAKIKMGKTSDVTKKQEKLNLANLV